MKAIGASTTTFYQTGGTLRSDAPSYVERQADADLYDGLFRGEFCYVLHARQMGKSSLMVRTAARLREQGVAVAVLDLTALGRNLSAEQWYDGLLRHLGWQLDLEDDLEAFWLAHPRLSPLQRWMGALREVLLPHCPGRVVLFVDEIDAVRSLPFDTDEFFAAIRECYNRRTQDPEFGRLTFCLLGVASPSDLIQDTRTTPFNIGRRIELTDFGPAEAALLAAGLGREEAEARVLLGRVLHWTGGHPYLTQRLCQAVAGSGAGVDAAGVDRLCEELFLSSGARERDDNLLFVRERLLHSEADRASLLTLYEQVRRGKRVADDATSALAGLLRLSGIVRSAGGRFRVRNRIYGRVFDPEWVRTNMPDAELRRQRAAYRRGLMRAASVAVVVLTVMAGLALAAVRQARRADQQRRLAQARERMARRYQYAADMKVAQQAWEVGNIQHARELLEAQRPAPGQEDLRGFPWRLLWRLCQDESLITWRPHLGGLGALAFSRDGTTLAAGGEGESVKLWSRASRREIANLSTDTRKQHPEGGVGYLAFSPDGKRIISGATDLAARRWNIGLWDVGTKQKLANFASRIEVMDQSFPAAVSPDGNTLVAGGTDGTLKIWDLATRRERATIPGPGYPSHVVFSPDSKTLAWLRSPGIQLWDITTRREIARIEQSADPLATNFTCVAFSPDAKTLATGSQGGEIELWNMAARRIEMIFLGHQAIVEAVAFSPDGQTLASASEDNTVRLWSVAWQRELRTFRGHFGDVLAVAFSPDGKTLASASVDGTVKLWGATARREAEILPGPMTSVWSVVFSPDGKLLAAGGFDKTVQLWDVTARRFIGRLRGHTEWVAPVAFSPDGKTLASGSFDHTVRLWDLATKRPLAKLKGFWGFDGSLAFAPDGKTLAAGDEGGIVKLWNLATRQVVARLKAHTQDINGLVFTADGKLLVSAGHPDPTVKLWDVASRRQVAAFTKDPAADIWSVALSADGKLLATASADGTVGMWSTVTRQAVVSKGHAGAVNFVAFSPDGATLASAGYDKTVRLWDMVTKREVASLKGHTGRVMSVAFSPDGNLLASGGLDGTVRLWRAANLAETDAPAGTHQLSR